MAKDFTGTKGLFIFFILVLPFVLPGCSQQVVQNPVMPQQLSERQMASQSVDAAKPGYIIRSGDELEIKFFYNPNLNEKQKVRPDGRISLQLVHDVPAAGLTTKELEKVLTQKYSNFLKEPEITVIVTSFDSQKIFVDGEVRTPGMIALGGYMDLMQAIASAGGLNDSALRSQILIIRRTGLKQPFIIVADIGKVITGQDPSQNVALKPYDIVFVPKSRIAQVNTWVDLYLRKNIPFNFTAGFYRNLD
ncbi:MAG: sugar transporter [Thermodesulfobacteria bacterium]|nr:sugar transporter [Thermodesulfobacteriota bacterium]